MSRGVRIAIVASLSMAFSLLTLNLGCDSFLSKSPSPGNVVNLNITPVAGAPPSVAAAAGTLTITNVTLNGETLPTVCPGSQVAVEVTVDVGTGITWGSTIVSIDGNDTCEDHANLGEGVGQIVSFNVTAPAAQGGPFLVVVGAFSDDACTNDASAPDRSTGLTTADTTPPTITCAADALFECLAEVPAPDTNSVTVSDDCDPSPTVIHIEDVDDGGAGCVADPLVILRTYRATDVYGNSSECVQAFTVADTLPPTLTCPDDLLVECVADVPAPDTNMVTATDNCTASPVVTHVGDVDNGGTGCEADPLVITRTYRATDDCGNTSDCSQTITVSDTTAPTILCQADGGSVDPNCEATATFSAIITDNCCVGPDQVTVDVAVVSGSAELGPIGCLITPIDEGTVEVTCSVPVSDLADCPALVEFTVEVADCCGNDAEQCSATAEITDDIDPVLTCPAPGSIVEECDEAGGAAVEFTVTATDNCDPDVTVTCSPPSGSFFALGTTEVHCEAIDDCGNVDECWFDVTVEDTTPPDVTCSLEETMLWPPNHNMIDVGLSPIVGDDCDPNAGVVAVNVFSDEDDEEQTGSGNHSPDAKYEDGVLRLRSERKGDADGRVYLIVVEVQDGSLNSSTTCCTVTVPHDQSTRSKDAVQAQAADAEARCSEFVDYLNGAGPLPDGFFVVGDGPVIGPKQ